MPTICKQKDKNGNINGWRGIVRIKGHPIMGKTFKKKSEAQTWAVNTESEIRNGTYKYGQEKASKVTFNELADRYIEESVKGRHKSESTTIRILDYFKKHLGSYSLKYITTDLLLLERKKLCKSKKANGKQKNPNTVNRHFGTLSGAFRYGCKNLRWLDQNPCLNMINLKIHPKERRSLSVQEECDLIKVCKESDSTYLYPIVLLALTTGARRGEILNFTWKDIDFKQKIATIKESKNGRPRKIGLVDSVIDQLKPLFNRKKSMQSFVFENSKGSGGVDFRQSWECALRKADIKDFVFHGLRHHFCTFGGEIGASGALLRSQMGHSSSKMTDHYSHHDAQSARFIGP